MTNSNVIMTVWLQRPYAVNPLTGTLKPLHSNTVIGTPAVDVWLSHLVYSEEGTGRRGRAVAPPGPLLAVSNPTRQRPVYQLHVIRCGTIIVFAL